MEIEEALALLKYLVSHNRFHLVNRRDKMAQLVSRELAKSIVQQLTSSVFINMNKIEIILCNMFGFSLLMMVNDTISSLFL